MAKAQGVYHGRQKGTAKALPQRAATLRQRGLTVLEIATALGVSERTVFRYLMGSWLGKEVISLSPPPRRTVRTSHLVHGSSNLRTPRGALML